MPTQYMVPGSRLRLRYTPADLVVLAGLIGMPPHNVYFVDSSASPNSDTAGGGTRDLPFATLNYAMNGSTTPVTANAGDVVFVMPGHTETIVAASGCVLGKAGTFVIGLGQGAKRPTFNFTTLTTGTLDLSAANVLLANFNFTLTSLDAMAAPVGVSAAGCTIQGCYFDCAGATNQATLAILTTAAANRFTVRDCEFYGTVDAGMTAAIRIVGGDRIRIEDCVFQGAYSSGVGAIQGLTTLCTNAFISGNRINNLTASSTKAMVFVTGSTGMISNNRMQILSGSAPITGDAMSWVGGNYYAAVIAQLGVLI